MEMPTSISWLSLLLLGAVHGVNPAMGWLFAVSLGLQHRSRARVWGALVPLAVGHGAAILVAVVAAALLGTVLSPRLVRWLVGACLLAFGVAHLTRHRHPRYGGMRVGSRQLATWSFLMASAHGAGLMALPFLLPGSAPDAAVGHGGHTAPVEPATDGLAGAAGEPLGSNLAAILAGADLAGVMATVAHTAGYLLVTGLLAALVYEKLGLRLLRSAWLNVNLVWAVALVMTAVLTLVW